jgi:cell division protein FtsB
MTKAWTKHKKSVITGAQIVTIITLLAGIVGSYYNTHANSTAIDTNAAAIDTSSQWMKDAIKADRQTIQSLQLENAILKTKFDDLKEKVDANESIQRLKK